MDAPPSQASGGTGASGTVTVEGEVAGSQRGSVTDTVPCGDGGEEGFSEMAGESRWRVWEVEEGPEARPWAVGEGAAEQHGEAGSLRSRARDSGGVPGLLAMLGLSELQFPHLCDGDRAVLRVGDIQGTRQGGVSSSSTPLLDSPPRTGPAKYSHTPPTHWVPHSGPGTVACGEPFRPHPTHFPEEETGSGEGVQLPVRSAGWGHSPQDVPAPPKCRGTGRGGRAGRLVEAGPQLFGEVAQSQNCRLASSLLLYGVGQVWE